MKVTKRIGAITIAASMLVVMAAPAALAQSVSNVGQGQAASQNSSAQGGVSFQNHGTFFGGQNVNQNQVAEDPGALIQTAGQSQTARQNNFADGPAQQSNTAVHAPQTGSQSQSSNSGDQFQAIAQGQDTRQNNVAPVANQSNFATGNLQLARQDQGVNSGGTQVQLGDQFQGFRQFNGAIFGLGQSNAAGGGDQGLGQNQAAGQVGSQGQLGLQNGVVAQENLTVSEASPVFQNNAAALRDQLLFQGQFAGVVFGEQVQSSDQNNSVFQNNRSR